MNRLAAIGLSLFLFSVTASGIPAHGQETIVLNPSPICKDCVIRATAQMSIGRASGPGELPSGPTEVFEDSKGRFWLLFGNEEPMVFDSNGAFIGTVGRRGSGPGEYLEVTTGAAVGDSVVLIDIAASRATIIGPDLRPVRTVVLPGPVLRVSVVNWPDKVVLHMLSRAPGLAGWQLHFVSFATAGARIVSSFGPSAGERPRLLSTQLLLLSSVSDAGAFWAASQARYELTQWSSSGRLLRRLSSPAPWMANPTNSYSLGGRNTPPAPAVLSVMEDRQSRLWLFGITAAPNWRDAWIGKTLMPGDNISSSRLPSPNELYQTVVEVIDPRRSGVLARATWSGAIIGTLPNGRIVRSIADTSSAPLVVIIQIELGERE